MIEQILHGRANAAPGGEALPTAYDTLIKDFCPESVYSFSPRIDAPKAPAQNERLLATQTLEAIAGADLRSFGPQARAAQEVVKKFLGEGDRAAALKKYGPEFDRVIGNADKSFAQVSERAMPGLNAAKQAYASANGDYIKKFFRTEAQAEKLPENQRRTAKSLLSGVALNGTEIPGNAELARTFGKQPEFLHQLEQLSRSQQNVIKAGDSIDTAGKPILNAAMEQDRARIAYERAAQSVGNKSLAKSLNAERDLLAEQTKQLLSPPTDLSRARHG